MRERPKLRVALLALLAVAAPRIAHAAEPYRTDGQCAGFPRTALAALPGTCVGLVAAGLGTPRGVASLGPDIYVVDAGGHAPLQGRLLRLGGGGHDAPETLLTGLDAPTALARGPDGALYLALFGEIARLDVTSRPATLTPVVTGLPDTTRPPLTAFAFAPDGSLFIDVGANSASCEGRDKHLPAPGAACAETATHPPRASIIRVRLTPGAPVDAAAATVVATGLRNSEGLAVLPDGHLAATVNIRDFITKAPGGVVDENEPHDTLDVITPGADYGWPTCYDDRKPSPDYPAADCAAKHSPSFLLPGHASPLSVLLYRGDAIPALARTLLIPFHGFRANGHRLMAMPLTPAGGLTGTLRPVIPDWDTAPGAHPQGSPTSLAEMADGSVLITEDHNGTLLRLAHDGGAR